MSIRNRAKLVFAVVILFLVCCSNGQTVAINGNANPPPQKTTYWVIVMWTLIGTQYVSEVCPLPIDDRESVAAAANGWGDKNGRMTGENSVYSFPNREEAEKFRQEKKFLDLNLNAEELIKYLCIGRTLPPAHDYWVVTMRNYNDGKDLISEVCPLPPYDRQQVEMAANRFTRAKLGMYVEDVYRFTSQEEAEKFRRDKGFPASDLNANTLQKYLCSIGPGSSKADKSRPR